MRICSVPRQILASDAELERDEAADFLNPGRGLVASKHVLGLAMACATLPRPCSQPTFAHHSQG